mgnify:CR=1 FL=1
MKINAAGLALIKSFESLRLEAYMPTPDDVPTIGYGHTRAVAMGDTCTEEQADAWLLEDVAWAEECVESAVAKLLHENEHAALVSLCFNIGCHAFKGSTLVRLLNEGDFDAAEAQFARWNKQAGRELEGLTRRREAERELFATT